MAKWSLRTDGNTVDMFKLISDSFSFNQDNRAILDVNIVNEEGTSVDVQNPLPTDSDSVYVKDIWVDESITTGWSDLDSAGGDIVNIPFNNLHTAITYTGTDNPKTILVHFNRTVDAHQVGLGCAAHSGKNFSNVKVILLGSGEVERTVEDDSGNNTKYTSRNYSFEPQLFNALKLEFHTADEVTLTNITIQKAINTNSFIRVQKPDDTVVEVQGTTNGNLKMSLEEYDDTFLGNPLPTQGMELLVSRGLVSGYSVVQKFGQNDSLNTATYEDIWDGGGTYVYPADGTAPITKLVSDDNGDTEPIEVQGLDINGDLVVQTKTLTGTTAVTLDTPLWRVFRLKNIGTTDLLDNVCAINDGDTQDYACINNGNNQTLMALYTIPNGKTGYLYQGTNNLSDVTRGVSASGRLWMRQYGSVFQVKKTFGVSSDGNGFINVINKFPSKIPEKTDIRVDAIASANGVTLNTTFEILLIDDI